MTAAERAAEVLAQRFHEAYERLAPDFGYRTREASAVPWADVPEQNKALMVATCAEVLADPELLVDLAVIPRLAVTQEQAVDLLTDRPLSWLMDGTMTLRLPEWPTMPCPECPPQGLHVTPIPEGARVEVGGWEDLGTGEPRVWHPVAVATLAEVSKHTTFNMDGDLLAWEWTVTLTDIEPVEDQ